MGKTLVSFLIANVLLLFLSGPLLADCPQTLEALSAWYQTDPPFSDVSRITLVLEFRNASGVDLQFSDTGRETFQIWSVPGVIGTMPFTLHAAPSGTVASGNSFSYNLTVNLSSLPLTENRFGFRPVSVTLGTMFPDRVPLISASFTCVAASSVSVPTLTPLGMTALLLGVSILSVHILRKRQIHRKT